MKEGKLGAVLEAMRAELVDLLSHLEASLDFAEEGIDPRVGPEFAARLEKARGSWNNFCAPLRWAASCRRARWR